MSEYDHILNEPNSESEIDGFSVEYEDSVRRYFDEIFVDDRFGRLIDAMNPIATVESVELIIENSADIRTVAVTTELIGDDPYSFTLLFSHLPGEQLSATANGDGTFSVYDSAMDHVYILSGYDTAKIMCDIIGADDTLLDNKLKECKNDQNTPLFQELIEQSWESAAELQGTIEDTWSLKTHYYDVDRQLHASVNVNYTETNTAGNRFKELSIQKILNYTGSGPTELRKYSITFMGQKPMARTAIQRIYDSATNEYDFDPGMIALDANNPEILQEFIDAYEAVLNTITTTPARL